MKCFQWGIILFFLVTMSVVSGCGSSGNNAGSLGKILRENSQPTVAVVSLAVNDYAGSISYSGGTNSAALIDKSMAEVLEITESTLSKSFRVKAAITFIDNPIYRKLSIGKVKDGLLAPRINMVEMPSFTSDRKEIVKSVLAPETAKKLCEALDVDLILVAYSEWAVASGSFVPTQKALAKNCIAMYDRTGSKLFFRRKDVQGEKTLGAMGRITVNEDTIGEWVTAYEKGLISILNSVTR